MKKKRGGKKARDNSTKRGTLNEPNWYFQHRRLFFRRYIQPNKIIFGLIFETLPDCNCLLKGLTENDTKYLNLESIINPYIILRDQLYLLRLFVFPPFPPPLREETSDITSFEGIFDREPVFISEHPTS